MNRSYAQHGEDLAIDAALYWLGVGPRTYLDIGAYHPTEMSNTFLFYMRGARGVLVEPDPEACAVLRGERPGDTVVQAGAGPDDVPAAEFYAMSDPSWSTFGRADALRAERGSGGRVKAGDCRRVPLVSVNALLAGMPACPAILSIDAEGMTLAVLRAVDFGRFRPPVVCVEVLAPGWKSPDGTAACLMAARDYYPLGGSFVNTVFGDGRLLERCTP